MSVADASSLNLWSALSLLGLVLVIFGVLMEGAEAFIWTISWFRRKRLSIIWNVLPEPRIPRWAHKLDHVGWFILVIGLALETWGHIRVTDITSRENRRLTAQLDSTTRQAAEANKQSAIASSNTVAEASKVEELRLNNNALLNELVFALSPWELDISSSFFVPLMPFSNMVASVDWGPSTLRTFSDSMIPTNLPGNLDSMQVADDIANNLKIAGWNVEHTDEYDVPPGEGVYVEVNEHALMNARFKPFGTNAFGSQPWSSELNRIRDLTDRAERASEALVADLTNHGIAAQHFPGSSKQPVGTVRIMVGQKPNPFNEIRRMAEEQKFDEVVQKQLAGLNLTNSLRRNVPSSPK